MIVNWSCRGGVAQLLKDDAIHLTAGKTNDKSNHPVARISVDSRVVSLGKGITRASVNNDAAGIYRIV